MVVVPFSDALKKRNRRHLVNPETLKPSGRDLTLVKSGAQTIFWLIRKATDHKVVLSMHSQLVGRCTHGAGTPGRAEPPGPRWL